MSNAEERYLQQAKDAWKSAAIPVGDEQTKVLLAQGNLRLNVRSLFAAAYYLTKAYVKAKTVILTAGTDPLAILEVGTSAFSAISSSINTFSQKLNAAEFLACVYLSQTPDGIPTDQFKAGFQEFLQEVLDSKVELPWYLAITTGQVQKAAAFLADPKVDVLAGKEVQKLISVKNGRYVYEEMNFEWGFAGNV